MNLSREWLLRNGIDRETLDKAMADGSVQQPLPFIDPEITFDPVVHDAPFIWLTINGWRPASLNELNKGVKISIRLKKRDRDVLCYYAMRIALLPKATQKRRVSLKIRVPKGQRRHDPDAFWKSCLDAAKHAELIVDDGPRWLELGRMDYDPQRGPLRTVLVLENL
jgi:hypothetical protein